MKNTIRRHIAAVAIGLLWLTSPTRAQSVDRPSRAPDAGPIAIPMTADRWQTKENAEFFRQLGFYHGLMRLNSGTALLKDTTFSDGTIEFDVETIGRGMPGIAFRLKDRLHSGDVQVTVIKGGGHRLSAPHEIDAILRAVAAVLEPNP